MECMNEGPELPHLTTFSKAAELHSFSGAAKCLGVTQAAVSQRIHALEEAVGKSLFQRRGGRILLTDVGRKLYDYAQRIIDLHREARRELGGAEPPTAGELAIAASSIPGEYLLPSMLAGFGKRYPHIRVHATICDSTAVIAQVERGNVSLGLVGLKLDDPNLDFRHLANDRMVLVVPPGREPDERKRISLKQLGEYPLVLRGVGSGSRHCFEKSLERVGKSLADMRVILELGSNESIKQAVMQGVGAAVMSALAVEKDLQEGRLRALEVSGLPCEREMFVVQDRRRVLALPARLFLLFLETNKNS
jgi:DNA-binding transcriptional LysR family regulator